MKKKLLILLCSLLLGISLVGCGSESSVENKPTIGTQSYGGREFLVIDYKGDDWGYLYVDVETKVQYIQFSNGTAARITILVDADGKPILYEGDE